MSDYHVLTAAGALIHTFADRSDALRFARSKRTEFPGCHVVMVQVVTNRVRIWTDRATTRALEAA